MCAAAETGSGPMGYGSDCERGFAVSGLLESGSLESGLLESGSLGLRSGLGSLIGTTEKNQIFPRIVTVGSSHRAATLASFFDDDRPVQTFVSTCGFNSFSGHYNGVGVSVVAIGMGAPMMECMMREVSRLQQGNLAVVRFGTCGILKKESPAGTVFTSGSGCMYAQVNYAYNKYESENIPPEQRNALEKPYLYSGVVKGDGEMNDLLFNKIKDKGIDVVDGLTMSAETFYSCQGRKDDNFEDDNLSVVDEITETGAVNLEMESHALFHMAKLRKNRTRVASCAIGIVNRVCDLTSNIGGDEIRALESSVGEACLDTLAHTSLADE